MASKQKQVNNRKRPDRPRVQIEYEVEINGSEEKKELAFVVGVMGDYVGDPRTELKSLDERKFIGINEENFDDVMQRLQPGLDLQVENTLAGDGSKLEVNLDFNSMEDFTPGKIIEQVDPLKNLLATRNKLRELQTNVEKSKQAEKELEKLLQDPAQLKAVADQMGVSSSGGAPAVEPEPEPAADAPDSGDDSE